MSIQGALCQLERVSRSARHLSKACRKSACHRLWATENWESAAQCPATQTLVYICIWSCVIHTVIDHMPEIALTNASTHRHTVYPCTSSISKTDCLFWGKDWRKKWRASQVGLSETRAVRQCCRFYHSTLRNQAAQKDHCDGPDHHAHEGEGAIPIDCRWAMAGLYRFIPWAHGMLCLMPGCVRAKKSHGGWIRRFNLCKRNTRSSRRSWHSRTPNHSTNDPSLLLSLETPSEVSSGERCLQEFAVAGWTKTLVPNEI